MTGQRPPVATCSSCSDLIIWCKTVYGNKMPVDAEPTETGGNIVLSDQRPVPVADVVSKTGREPGQKLYVSHFSTCRKADKHRGKGASRPSAPPVMPQDGLFSEVPR